MFNLESLSKMRDGTMDTMTLEQHDRHMYIQGREGYPTLPEDTLTARERGCYMMGYNVSEWEDSRV